MAHVQQFIDDNLFTLYELQNLELICIDDTGHHKTEPNYKSIRTITRRKYEDLLRGFEAILPASCTAMHLLYWAFLRTRIANAYLESKQPGKAHRVLNVILQEVNKPQSRLCSLVKKFQSPNGEHCDNGSEHILLSIFAGLFQTLFNQLAAALPTSSSTDESDEKSTSDWLHAAKRVYELYVTSHNQNVGPLFWETIAFKDIRHLIGGDHMFSIEGSSILKEMTPERLLFEHGYTSTVFLLAQTYQLSNETKHAAVCCQLTLCRQLTFARPFEELPKLINPNLPAADQQKPKRSRASSARCSRDSSIRLVFGSMQRRFAHYVSTVVKHFDPFKWAGNVLSLSRYHASVDEIDGYYHATLECLLSALFILEHSNTHSFHTDIWMPSTKSKDTLRSSKANRLKIIADVHRELARLGLALLERGSQGIADYPKLFQEDYTVPASQSATSFGSMFQLNLYKVVKFLIGKPVKIQLADCAAVNEHSPSVEQYVDILATYPTSREHAYTLFRVMIMYCLNKAEEYYTLEEHCSDAVALKQMRSKAYKYLVTFEPDVSRQCCFHKRRADMLEKVLEPLNHHHYLILCRELLFELADALSCRRDLKCELHEQSHLKNTENSTHYGQKSNVLTKRALTVYQKFLNTFKESSNRKPVHTLSAEELRPILLAHFYSARLASKLRSTTRMEQINHLTKAFQHYQFVVSLTNAHMRLYPHSELGGKSRKEFEVAQDMVNLLPVKLQRLSRDPWVD